MMTFRKLEPWTLHRDGVGEPQIVTGLAGAVFWCVDARPISTFKTSWLLQTAIPPCASHASYSTRCSVGRD